MDVDYGKGLQELFLNNYKIIAVIESKVERWFEEADINTCIIILEKCNDTKERDENIVRFVYLFKPLRHFIPPAQYIWEKEKERLHAIDNLIETILFHDDFYQTDDFRIFPKKQKELWEEGLDKKSGKYEGAKWGKYIRAPEIFFKILEKGRGKLVPLKNLANVKFGIKTGANEFFYLTEDDIQAKGIEKEFCMHKDEKGNWVPNYVIKSPRECKSVFVKPRDLKYRILMIHKDKRGLKGKNVLKYIQQGERKGFHLRPTCASREKWYDLGHQRTPDGIWFKAFNDRFFAPGNIKQSFSSDRFYAIYLKNKAIKNKLFLYLNSTLPILIVELFGRVNLGEGALDNMTYEAASMFVLDVREESIGDGRLFKKFLQRPMENIFKELGATSTDEVSLNKVKPDRRELDKIIMGDILGLTEKEQLEVYGAVVDLVKSRIDKAKSVKKKGKIKEGVDVEHVSRVIMDKLGKGLYRKFYDEKVLSQKKLKEVKLFSSSKEPIIDNSLFGWRIMAGKDIIQCANEEEARYLKVWLDIGLTEEVKVPTDEKYLKRILPELEKLQGRISRIISEHIESITSQKLQNQIMHRLQRKLFEQDC
jgi:hypothetical protein